MLLYIEACEAGSMFDGILDENTGGSIIIIILLLFIYTDYLNDLISISNIIILFFVLYLLKNE